MAGEKSTPNTPVIGLTGGIASGKSTVSGHLRKKGAHVIDADGIGHRVIAPDGEAFDEVVAAFGGNIVGADGAIDRRKLGAIVFGDPARLDRLNAISHPRMAARMAREIQAVRAGPEGRRPPLIVLDAAILFEAGWDALCDEVWVVTARPETAIGRLMARDGMSRAEAQARLAAQMEPADRAKKGSRLIANDGAPQELERQVAALWRGLRGQDAAADGRTE